MHEEQRPHVLKRSKSSLNRDGERQARVRPLVEDGEQRRSNILSVIIFPLTGRKSKSNLRTPSPSSSDSDNSSLWSRPSTPSSAAAPAHQRSASDGTGQRSHRVRPKYGDDIPSPPPVPKIPSPTSDTWAKLPKRSQSKRERPKPIVANVEGYWDHLDLLDYHEHPKKRGRDLPFPISPAGAQMVPVPF